MKIAFIGQKGMPTIYGGVERHVEELASRLVDFGYDVTAYTRPHYTAKDKTLHNGIKLKSTLSINTKHLDAITGTFTASVHALFQDYDIIHYHAVGPALLSWIPRIFKPKAKVVVTFHCIDRQHQKWGGFARVMLWLGEWCACKFAHEVITVSRTLKHYTYEVYNRETNYIPNGINEVQNVKPSIIKEEFDLKGDDYITVVSRLVKHKGIHYLIKAYQELNTHLKLVIVGDSAHTDGYVKYLKRLAKKNPNIIFTGYQSGQALEELFSNAYLYVQPSESEGLPISVLEAASYGNCVLASDIPANLEIVKHCGLSFENKNVEDLKEKLAMLIKNKQEVEDVGKQARKFVLEHYNWKDIAQDTHQLYKQLAKERSAKIAANYKIA